MHTCMRARLRTIRTAGADKDRNGGNYRSGTDGTRETAIFIIRGHLNTAVPRTRRNDKRSRTGEKEKREKAVGSSEEEEMRSDVEGEGRFLLRVVRYEVTMKEKREIMHRSGGGEEEREEERNRLQ